jgi:acyl-CoA oxidase
MIFDEKSDEFIINSPTIGSTKYWIGDLGVMANYSLVYG